MWASCPCACFSLPLFLSGRGGVTDLHPLGRSFVPTLSVHQVHSVGGQKWLCVPLDMFTGNRWLLRAASYCFRFPFRWTAAREVQFNAILHSSPRTSVTNGMSSWQWKRFALLAEPSNRFDHQRQNQKDDPVTKTESERTPDVHKQNFRTLEMRWIFLKENRKAEAPCLRYCRCRAVRISWPCTDLAYHDTRNQ